MSINGISSLHEVAHFFSQYYNLIILQLQYEEVRSRTVSYIQENVEEASF